MFDDLFTGNILFFSIPAIGGTLFFLLRLGMSLTGLDGPDADLHTGDLGADGHHSSEIFKVLSIQSIASFLMGFGWGGLGGLKGMGWEFGPSLLSAVAGGIVMVWMLSWLLKLMHDMQTTGTMSIREALDAEGDVYVGVPPKGQGSGQVRIVVNERARTYSAISQDQALPTKTRVRVVHINDDNTVTVAPI